MVPGIPGRSFDSLRSDAFPSDAFPFFIVSLSRENGTPQDGHNGLQLSNWSIVSSRIDKIVDERDLTRGTALSVRFDQEVSL